MAGYNEIRGLRVKYLSADPSNAEDGQVWYNSTTGNLRVEGIGVAAWSSGGPLVSAVTGIANTGTQTASIAYGGNLPPNTTAAYEYNGSGWSTAPSLPEARSEMSKAGTQTAVISTGGKSSAPGMDASFEYNGSSWTAGGTMGTARYTQDGDGTQTAAFICGGQTNPPLAPSAKTEEYDGTSWTNGGDLNQARNRIKAAGTQTAGLALGGSGYPLAVGPIGNSSEEYDGSSWTAGNSINTARYSAAAGGAQTSALLYGGTGSPATLTATETYDGTSYTTSPASLATGRSGLGGDGGNNAYLAVGGSTPSRTSATEEYNFSTSTITAAAWSSNPALSYSVDANLASSGSLTSAVAAGGYNAPAGPGTVSYIAKAATWNGTAWSNITDMPVRRTSNNAVGATAPAFYTFGGQNQPGPSTSTHLPSTFNWNGSSWGAGPNLAEGQAGGAAAGIPNAIVLMGGTNPPGSISNNIQQYNGSSWSNSPVNMPTNMSSNGGVGTQTAAISFGGYQGASPFPSAGVTNTYEWDGSSISSGGSMVFGLLGCSGSGTSTAALSYGGRNTAGNKNAIGMLYNGTSWATSPSLGTARDYIAMGPMGSATSCLAVAGSGGAQSLVEEFTGETTTVNPARNITTS